MSMCIEVTLVRLKNPIKPSVPRVEAERVELYAIQKCNLRRYMVMDNTYSPDKTVSNKLEHTYRFPEVTVNQDDIIYLWTKAGDYRTTVLKSGQILHHFFWGLDETIWNETGDKAKLIYIGEIKVFDVPAIVP